MGWGELGEGNSGIEGKRGRERYRKGGCHIEGREKKDKRTGGMGEIVRLRNRIDVKTEQMCYEGKGIVTNEREGQRNVV